MTIDVGALADSKSEFEPGDIVQTKIGLVRYAKIIRRSSPWSYLVHWFDDDNIDWAFDSIFKLANPLACLAGAGENPT